MKRMMILLLLTLLLIFPEPEFGKKIPAGIEEYIIVGREYQLRRFFHYINEGEGTTDNLSYYLDSVVTLTATLDGQKIIYDHWEDGYEKYPLNPTQPTTEVYILNRGDVLSLKSNEGSVDSINGSVTTTVRGRELRYDGGDRIISVGGPVDVAHSIWPHNQTYIGGAFEIYPEAAFEGYYNYIIPFGEDTYDYDGGDFSIFKYVALEIVAFKDDTTILLDNGNTQLTIHLNKGDFYNTLGYINDVTDSTKYIQVISGMRVVSNKEIQISMLTGSFGQYQTRFFDVLPIKIWGRDYIAPVISTGTYPANIYLFNPNSSPIDITIYDKNNTSGFTFTLDAYQSTSYKTVIGSNIPYNTAVRLQSNSLFWGVAAIDYSTVMYDWGYSLIPTRLLEPETYVSWAPGSEDLSANGSPVIVSPTISGTEFHVDFDNDGNYDEVDIDGDGNPDPGPYIVNNLQYLRIYDPNDNDNTGTHIVADNPFVTVYGEDPTVAGTSTPYLDLGYSILPLSQSFISPILDISLDANKYSVPPYGGEVTFNATISTGNYLPVTVEISDFHYPIGITYVHNSGEIIFPDGTTVNVEPTITEDSSTQYISWITSATLNSNQKVEIIFALRFPQDIPDTTYIIQAHTRGFYAGIAMNPTDSLNIAKTFLKGTKKVTSSTIGIHEYLTYYLQITNTSSNTTDIAQNVVITDTLEENLAFSACKPACLYDSGSKSIIWNIGDLNPGQTFNATITAEVLPAPAGTIIHNRASIKSDNLTTVYTNAVTTLIVPPVVRLFKYSSADTEGEVHTGDIFNYFLTVTNISLHTAHQVIIRDVIPPQVKYVPNSLAIVYPTYKKLTDDPNDDEGDYNGTTLNGVSFLLPELNPGKTYIFSFAVEVTSGHDWETLSNTFTLESEEIIQTASNIHSIPILPVDIDGDGIPNLVEDRIGTDRNNPDTDGDSISDGDEILPYLNHPPDTDKDGTIDALDTDSDNDGIPDSIEAGDSSISTPPVDTDNDGIPDFRDLDSDNDTILDRDEQLADPDHDNIPAFRDTDSDNDSLPDSYEAGDTDPTTPPLWNHDGDIYPDFIDPDDDNDGIDTYTEMNTSVYGNPVTDQDIDGDGVLNYLDLDSDGDGKSDSIEGTGDVDGDGIPNFLDADDSDGPLGDPDGDHLVNKDEDFYGTDRFNPDTDGDGLSDYTEVVTTTTDPTKVDSDGDTIPDPVEIGPDIYHPYSSDVTTDSCPGVTDTTIDALDTDSDGDGISDLIEVGYGKLATPPVDSDGDGIPDYRDRDSDNDGICDYIEARPFNADGTPHDADGDGIPDYLDKDSDNGGVPDYIENLQGTDPRDPTDDKIVDSDGDNLPDLYEDSVPGLDKNNPDSDGNGVRDDLDDLDGDGFNNYGEYYFGTDIDNPDTDGDHITDGREVDYYVVTITNASSIQLPDADGDGRPDVLDNDSDNDGISDLYESFSPTTTTSTPADHDNDGVFDFRDRDSDNDYISDSEEAITPDSPADTDKDGVPDFVDADSDNDTIPDSIEAGDQDYNTPATDTDGDGVPDYRDLDSDNDLILDKDEGYTDPDNDSILNFRDIDSDGDSVTDTTEAGDLKLSTPPIDSDGDSTPDFLDTDDDNDNIPTITENNTDITGDHIPDRDVDADGIPNYLDSDSDGDGKTDLVEGTGDIDGDGIPNYLDKNDSDGPLGDPDGDLLTNQQEDTYGTDKHNPDTDGDGLTDYTEVVTTGTSPTNRDSDNDTIDDKTEVGDDINHPLNTDATYSGPCTTDSDNLIDALDTDSDGDGLEDIVEVNYGASATPPVDSDGDGIPNYRDPDSDNDGYCDYIEVRDKNGQLNRNSQGYVIPYDNDGDGIPDYLDNDTDNGGLPDYMEKQLGTNWRDPSDDKANLVDSDGDNLPDTYEIKVGLDPHNPDTDGDGIRDDLDDKDGDGFNNYGEYYFGTDINNPDTDGDYIKDGEEVDYYTITVTNATSTLLPDTDHDGTPDVLDTDSDNDNIPDSIEEGDKNIFTTAWDTDGDGIPDYRDLDSDNDGKPDKVEGYGDVDGDGIPNFRDPDDSDGPLGDPDGDGLLNYQEAILGTNAYNPDTDGDYIDDYTEVSNPDSPADTDGDGIIDALDSDSDNDNIPDSVEAGDQNLSTPPIDHDGDGIPDFRDIDSDNDYIPDKVETIADTDGDSIPNYIDTDSDNDSVPDKVEAGDKSLSTPPIDHDFDKIPDYLDTDDDNDHIPTYTEMNTDINGDHISDTDVDKDGIPNYLDLDSDGDHKLDFIEGTGDKDGDGIPNFLDSNDNDGPLGDLDGDGLTNQCEESLGLNKSNPDTDGDHISDGYEAKNCEPIDTDNDGVIDALDNDSDNDTISDLYESGYSRVTSSPVDTDKDGIPDFRDQDSDNDCILDSVEAGDNDISTPPQDFDNDGKPDYIDTDSDNDLYLDAIEGFPTGASCSTTISLTSQLQDTDGDGIPDIHDSDTDNGGDTDLYEHLHGTNWRDPSDDSNSDPDHDGLSNQEELYYGTDPTDPDTDKDGLLDGVEVYLVCYTDGQNIKHCTDPTNPDTDGDSIPDGIEAGKDYTHPLNSDSTSYCGENTDAIIDALDTDSDNDTITDYEEVFNGKYGENPPDSDHDGIPDYRDKDSDNDGYCDYIEANPWEYGKPHDADRDGVPDYLDRDTDNGGVPDYLEKLLGTNWRNPYDDHPEDYDGDGLPNIFEEQYPGYLDPYNPDTDGDGIKDGDEDFDNDGLTNLQEYRIHTDILNPDTDGDYISDGEEVGPNPNKPYDDDRDGIINAFDNDSDNDGIPDKIEAGDKDLSTPAVDTDGDGRADYRDPDSDDPYNKSIPDSIEGTSDPDHDGLGNWIDTDDDGDMIPDKVEMGSDPLHPRDTDGDGIPDYLDTDSDNDGKSDILEGTGDIDADGIPNYIDANDNDGPMGDLDHDYISNHDEGYEVKYDNDGDGIPDYLDKDSDNDGIPDSIEAGDKNLYTPPIDSDGDGIPDFRDPDSNNNGIPDSEEGTADKNHNGIPDYRDTTITGKNQPSGGEVTGKHAIGEYKFFGGGGACSYVPGDKAPGNDPLLIIVLLSSIILLITRRGR